MQQSILDLVNKESLENVFLNLSNHIHTYHCKADTVTWIYGAK